MNTWGMKIGDVMRKFGEVPVGVPTADPDDEPDDTVYACDECGMWIDEHVCTCCGYNDELHCKR